MSGAPWTSRAAAIVPAPRRRGLAIHDLDGEAVVAHPGNGDTFHLNPTARLVLSACDGRHTTRQMAAMLAERYDVDPDDALDDVEELVLWLAASDLLEARS